MSVKGSDSASEYGSLPDMSDCKICMRKGKRENATYCCPECQSTYCNDCEQSLHRVLHSNHKVLDEKAKARWCRPVLAVSRSGAGAVSGYKPSCSSHTDKDSTMFCETHRSLCCTTCVTKEHRTCTVKSIAEAASGITKRAEFTKQPSTVSDLKKKLASTKKAKEANISSLKQANKSTERNVQQLEEAMRVMITQLMIKTVEQMNERYESIRKSINEDIEACDSLISRLNTASSAKDKSLKTDQEIFINFLESEKAVLEASRLLKEVDQEEVQLLFKQDPDITVFLTSKQLLGYFEVTPDNTGTVVSTKTLGVKTADDQKNCDVTGLCQFANGYVMIDSRNQKVKKLNNIFQVVAEHLLPQYPYNVCTISEKEIAVTVCDWSNKKEIRFLSETKGKFEVKKVIPLKHDCSGLAIVNGQLYVGSPEGIFVYKTTGEKVKQLSTIKVQNFALTLDNSRIIVPDKDKNVFVTIDQKTGNEITKCGIKDMKGPTDVCFAGSGTAFVCDNMSNNIVLVDKSVTRSLKTVARDTDGVCKPNCLYYNEKTAELLVGQDWDKIVVLQMKRA